MSKKTEMIYQLIDMLLIILKIVMIEKKWKNKNHNKFHSQETQLQTIKKDSNFLK